MQTLKRISAALHRRWEALVGVFFTLAVVITHLVVTYTWPLNRSVFQEGKLVFFDSGGSEAYTHLDRLVTGGAMNACNSGAADCIRQVLEAGDRHHPPVMAVTVALWNQLVGLGISESLLINLLWLALLIGSVHTLARRMGGPVAGWIATFLITSAPVIIGPSRLLHEDLPMMAFLAAFGASCFVFVERPRLYLLPLIPLTGILAVLSKWEMIFGIASAGLAAGFFALTQEKRVKTLPALLVAAVLIVAGLSSYVRTIPSVSFQERPQLHFLASTAAAKMYLSQFIDREPEPVEPGSISGTTFDRLIFYGEAMPVAAAGLLPSLAILLGALIQLYRRQWRYAVFTFAWVGVSLALISVMVTTFGDDRFVHFFLMPLTAFAAAGLASLPRPQIALLATAVIFGLHLWDMSFTPSPLPLQPAIQLPKPGNYVEFPRVLNLRPHLPIGHGTWVRPENRSPSGRKEIQEVLVSAKEAGSRRIILSPLCKGLCEASYVWVVESLLMPDAPPIGLGVAAINMAADPSGKCKGFGEKQLKREFKEGTWLILDVPLGQETLLLEDINWEQHTCGYFSDPLDVHLVPHLVKQISGPRGTLAIVRFGSVLELLNTPTPYMTFPF